MALVGRKVSRGKIFETIQNEDMVQFWKDSPTCTIEAASRYTGDRSNGWQVLLRNDRGETREFDLSWLILHELEEKKGK
jgi:hypothetical protein